MASTSADFQEVDVWATGTLQLCSCVVCYLLDKRFSSQSFIEKLNIINQGSSKPAMKNLTTKIKTCTRHFNADKSYEQYEWLTGCEIRNKLFCWPCLLFVNENGLWNKSGFGDLNNLHKVVKQHIMSKPHLHAVIKEKVFGKTQIEHALDKQLQVSLQKHNELVDKNRDILKRLIDIVCFLGFRSHDESNLSANRGNYLDLVSLISKYDPCLKTHLEQSNVFQGTSNQMQNDLISAISTVVLNKIKDEIKQTRFIAIILDESVDVTNFSQVSAVVRFVNVDGNVQERFLGFINVSEDRTVDALYNIVCELIKNIDANDKLIAQSYDGAAVMAGHLGGLQVKVQATFPSAIFIHCFAHKLNLVLSQSVMQIKECKVFFSTLSGMAAFFSNSTKRAQALDAIVKRRLPKVAPTRWNYNGRLVLTIFEHRDSLIELFESILENSTKWDTETINGSRGFLDSLKNDFNFNFLILVFSEIFPFSDNLFNLLQCKTIDIGLCITKICEFKNVINKKRDDFEKCWENTNGKSLELQKKRVCTDNVGDIKPYYRRLFYQILDQIYQEIDNRFKNFEDLNFLELCNFSAFKGKQFPENQLKSLMCQYGQYFDVVLLRSELIALYDTEDIDTKMNASELLTFLRETALDKAYSEVITLCELVLTIPATSAFGECSFSVPKRIKTYMRNSTGQDQLSNVSPLAIENNLVWEMSQHPRFYNEVIEEFAKNDRRIELHYKWQVMSEEHSSETDPIPQESFKEEAQDIDDVEVTVEQETIKKEEYFDDVDQTSKQEKINISDCQTFFNQEVEDICEYNEASEKQYFTHQEVDRTIQEQSLNGHPHQRDKDIDNVEGTINLEEVLIKEEAIKEESEDIHEMDLTIKQEEIVLSDCESTITTKVQTYKCETCNFQTNKMCYLKKHSKRMHFDLNEVTFYKCETCEYRTKDKTYLKYHQKLHLNSDEVEVYKCATCSFQTRHKMGLKMHQKRHLRPKNNFQPKLKELHEVKFYKCETCDFQSKYKESLGKHKKLHLNPDDVVSYKCTSCTFQTRFKYNLKHHLRRHDLDPNRFLKCETCDFQTINKSSLRKHEQRHMNPDEVVFYKCATCKFKTRFKYSLKYHLKQHDRDPNRLYKCETCDYRTRYERNLRYHSTSHLGDLGINKVKRVTFDLKKTLV